MWETEKKLTLLLQLYLSLGHNSQRGLPCCSWKKPGTFLALGICSGYFPCLECSSHSYLLGQLLLLRVCSDLSLSMRTPWSNDLTSHTTVRILLIFLYFVFLVFFFFHSTYHFLRYYLIYLLTRFLVCPSPLSRM